MNLQKIGKFIAEVRKEHNLTQQDLANRLGITDRAISHWENGRSLPDVSLFKDLCNILDISINELISGERINNDKIIMKSDENIINTLVENKKVNDKARNTIFCLLFLIIMLVLVLVLGIKDKYPKVDLFNFTIQRYTVDLPYKLSKEIEINDRSVFYYGLDFAIFCNIEEQCYQVNDALFRKQITLEKFQEYLEKQIEYGNYERMDFYDGGTKVYSKDGIQIIYCNTVDGNKDVYIGNDEMLDNLNGEYCGHNKNPNESFIRTYKIISTEINENDDVFNYVTLEQNNGNRETVILNNTYELVPGHVYEFSFLAFEKFEDSIKNIFEYSTLLTAKEIDKNEEQINEKIIFNDLLESAVELNELENVRMDIVEGTLNSTSSKVIITDFTNHKYTYGSYYRIDRKDGNEWIELDKKNRIMHNDMAYHPDENGYLEFDINWEYAYGSLSRGKYRIVKDALVSIEGCDPVCKHYYFSVEFEID